MRQSGKRIFSPALLVMLAGLPASGEQFPVLQAEDLNGQKVTMPALTAGKQELLIIGFSRAASEQTKDWGKRIPKDLPLPYHVAALGDAPRLMRGVIVRSMKGGVPKEQRDHFLILYQNQEDLKAAAQFQAPDEAYLILLAADGSIQWRFHGAFTHTALKALRAQWHGVRQ